MATRIKGTGTTPSLTARQFTDVGYTAQNVLDSYASRVAAASGEMIDEAAALAAITYLRDAGLLGRVGIMASPAWGVKKTADRYDNLYSIVGPDLEGFTVGTGGAKPLADVDAADNPVAVTDVNSSRIGGLFRTTASLALAEAADQWCAIWTSMSALSGLIMQVGFGNLPQSGTGHLCAGLSRSATLNSWTAQRSDYNPAAAADATKRMSANATNSGRADTVGIALALKVATGEIRLIIDGDEVASATSSTGALYDYVSLLRPLYVGGAYDAAAVVPVNRKGQLREVGVLTRCTIADLLALTEAISARYAA